jgi:hypothetical protein
MKMEAEIRPKTGKVGINLSFREEDDKGDGALLRLENVSAFPIWVAQDGIAILHATQKRRRRRRLTLPSDRMTFTRRAFSPGNYTQEEGRHHC